MGEINNYDKFGAAIIDTVIQKKLYHILEIGSWDGTGSTQCFIEGLRRLNSDSIALTCLEVEPDRFASLVENTKHLDWVKCHNRSSISYKNLVYKDFNLMWNSPHNGIPKHDHTDKKNLVEQWFKTDTDNIKRFETGFLEDYPNTVYDGVLIDGSEFTGFSEFKLLKHRTNVFFLDDYYAAFKTREVARNLEADPDWVTLVAQPHLRNGFAIIARRVFL